jgi:hypothetical protein
MKTKVEKGSLLKLPEALTTEFGIEPGNFLEWEHSNEPGVLKVTVLKNRASAAASLLGAGRRYLKNNQAAKEFAEERERESRERDLSL